MGNKFQDPVIAVAYYKKKNISPGGHALINNTINAQGIRHGTHNLRAW